MSVAVGFVSLFFVSLNSMGFLGSTATLISVVVSILLSLSVQVALEAQPYSEETLLLSFPEEEKKEVLALLSRNDKNAELAKSFDSNPLAFVEHHFNSPSKEVVEEITTRRLKTEEGHYSFLDAITPGSEEHIILRRKIIKLESKF